MKISPIRFRIGPFKVTIGAEKIRDILLDFVTNQIDWQSIEAGMAEHVGSTDAKILTDWLKARLRILVMIDET